MTTKRGVGLGALALGLMAAGCGRFAARPSSIAQLSASPSAVTAGQTVQLTAQFSGGSGEIDGVGPIVSGVPLTVTPPPPDPLESSVVTYTLTVHSDTDTLKQSISVEVVAAPRTPQIVTVTEAERLSSNLFASVEPQQGMSYHWQLSGGALISAADDPTLVFSVGDLGQAVLTCTASNALGATSATASANIRIYGMKTFAGQPMNADYADGTGTQARFAEPCGLAVDASGHYFVGDANNRVLREIDSSGVVTTFAGKPGVRATVDGVGSDARFTGPFNLLTLRNGDMIVADQGSDPDGGIPSSLRRVSPSAKVTTIQVLPLAEKPVGLAEDALGNIYWSDSVASNSSGDEPTIFRIDPDGGSEPFITGVYATALHVALDGKMYVATSDNTISLASPDGTLTHLTGTQFHKGTSDGPPGTALINLVNAFADDGSGGLYFVEASAITFGGVAGLVRHLSSDGTVTTLVTTPPLDNGAPLVVPTLSLIYPNGLAIDPNGDLLITDPFVGAVMQVRLPQPPE